MPRTLWLTTCACERKQQRVNNKQTNKQQRCALVTHPATDVRVPADDRVGDARVRVHDDAGEQRAARQRHALAQATVRSDDDVGTELAAVADHRTLVLFRRCQELTKNKQTHQRRASDEQAHSDDENKCVVR